LLLITVTVVLVLVVVVVGAWVRGRRVVWACALTIPKITSMAVTTNK